MSVDPQGRNEALRARWHLPFPVVSDPGGAALLQPLDAWNPQERDGIAWPALILFDPSGAEVFRMRSRDFADRPDDADLIDALRSLDLSAITLGAAPARAEPVEDPAAFRTDSYGTYFRGMRSATGALARRLTSEADRAEAMAMSAMAASFLDAWSTRRSAHT